MQAIRSFVFQELDSHRGDGKDHPAVHIGEAERGFRSGTPLEETERLVRSMLDLRNLTCFQGHDSH